MVPPLAPSFFALVFVGRVRFAGTTVPAARGGSRSPESGLATRAPVRAVVPSGHPRTHEFAYG